MAGAGALHREDGDLRPNDEPIIGREHSEELTSRSSRPFAVAPQDGFDPILDRWILFAYDFAYSDDTLLSVDLGTGAKVPIAVDWPWPEVNVHIDDFALDQDVEHIHAIVGYLYQTEPSLCRRHEYVSIDTSTGVALPLAVLEDTCGGGDDTGIDDGTWYQPVVDVANDSLWSLRSQPVDANASDYYLDELELGTALPKSSYYLYDGYCDYLGNPDVVCSDEPLFDNRPRDIAVDPLSTANVLLAMRGGELISYNHVEDWVDAVIELPAQWEGQSLGLNGSQILLVDPPRGRVFVTLNATDSIVTLEIDLESAEMNTVYAGAPLDGTTLRCVEHMAYDSLRDRILYRSEPNVSKNCGTGYFAVEVEGGEGYRLWWP